MTCSSLVSSLVEDGIAQHGYLQDGSGFRCVVWCGVMEVAGNTSSWVGQVQLTRRSTEGSQQGESFNGYTNE